MSLVVVSNRVARPKNDEPIAGGLAAALLPAVTTSGAIWVGSSGRLSEVSDKKESLAKVESLGKGALVTLDMPAAHYKGFYEGFANSALWPMLHSRGDLISVAVADYASYREINAFMARALLRFAKPESTFWIHDYHFLTLGLELRRLGIDQPVGFFLHTPFPNPHIVRNLPRHRELVRAMLSYDLIGFQTDEDQLNFTHYLAQEFSIKALGDTVKSERGWTRLRTFPIGIDAKTFAERAVKAIGRAEVARLRTSLHGMRLVIGVDRIDYSKGIMNRFHGFDRLLQFEPQFKRAISLLQIAVPSRGQISAYRQLQTELATLVGEINGRHGEVDWAPIRYLAKGYGHSVLAGFYRTARVGIVTSLHDGMNLVAKEYVAAQDPADPGVLVLSEFTGAARQLDAALLVNPHDIDAIAHTLAMALRMSTDERRERWQSMIEEIETSSLDAWFSGFTGALAACRGGQSLQDRRERGLVPFARPADGAATPVH
jgi:trehalose 6-phosphate synthase